jgi:hypothetical protein
MKIYFMSSPRGKKSFEKNYQAIFQSIESLGHTHVTDFIMDVEVENFYLSDIKRFYRHTVDDLKKAEVCVFETSVPSLAVGHLISLAIEQGKPIIALYSGKNAPFFLSGLDDDKVQIIQYGSDNLKDELDQAINYAQEQMDTRFNFFISPQIGNYLDWVSKKKRIPRAVYLRRLIEEDMKKNNDIS